MSDINVGQSVVQLVSESPSAIQNAQSVVQLVVSESPSVIQVAQSVVLVMYRPRPSRKQSIVIVAN